ncbi:MAG: hypothetical protein JWP51_475 [Bradyrhizobium sp.]|nr:hypothetical protein [Bradyrhizobium sp.]
MASILVRRDQFNITPQGITHKPTDAFFASHCGDPRFGSMRLGQLGNAASTGDSYDPDEVKRMMKQLWAEYVAANSDLFHDQRGRELINL